MISDNEENLMKNKTFYFSCKQHLQIKLEKKSFLSKGGGRREKVEIKIPNNRYVFEKNWIKTEISTKIFSNQIEFS